jgi:hypothetical protein
MQRATTLFLFDVNHLGCGLTNKLFWKCYPDAFSACLLKIDQLCVKQVSEFNIALSSAGALAITFFTSNSAWIESFLTGISASASKLIYLSHPVRA